MQDITIEKKRLLEIIKTNRKVHLEEYEKANEAYRASAIAEMKANLKEAQKGGEINHYISASRPTSFVENYDTVISMLELTEDETITLTYHEFQQYVEDKWSWRGAFEAVNSAYGVSVPKGPRGSAGLSGALGAI